MINRTLLTEIIHEQYRDLQSLPLGVERESLSEVLNAIALPHVVVITGMRRSGKSTLMLQASKRAFAEQVYYLDFEDERLLDFTVDDFNLLYEVFVEVFGVRKVFFFDEIQVVNNWESYVRRMYKTGNKFIISGSNADLLSSELSTKLTGRHVTIELLPFSFREYLKVSNNESVVTQPLLAVERGLLKQAFNQFSLLGGIPEYVRYQDALITKNIYENILYKDVIVRYKIKEVKALRGLSLWLLSNPGALISCGKLKNILQLGSVNTVKDYIHYLENAYLIFTLEQYAFSVATQTLAPKKVYGVDTGLMETLGFQFAKNSGKYLENIVYLELRRRYRDNHCLYYYKTKNNYEVDFCLRQGKKITQLIQVTECLDNEGTREREIRALITAMEELHLTGGLIITLDQTETLKIEGKTIQCVAIANWLLQD